MHEFVGKVALISAAGRGVGQEIALALSSLGVIVAANDINPTSIEETVSQITGMGGTSRGYVFDIARRMPIEALVTQVLDDFGRIDILINLASVEPEASILDMDEWEFHRTLDVNLGGPYFCTQQVGRAMRQQGSGAIVNIISTSRRGNSVRGYSAYLASQFGLLGLTCAAAEELSADHIRLNTILHGSRAMDFLTPRSLDMDALHQWQESLPTARLGDHPDLVNMVLFLCSDAAAQLTGQVISIDLENG